MTYEEAIANYKYDRAIDLIRRIKTEETHERRIDRHKAFDLAINALEKQIPNKPTPHIVKPVEAPVKIGCGHWGVGTVVDECPNCKEWVSKTYKYCPNCGQALDWS